MELLVEDATFVTMAAEAGPPSAGPPSAGQPSAGQPSAGQPSAGQPSAMLVRDGRIAAIGPADRVRAAAGGAAVVRLGGATVIPGLIDAHCHVTDVGYLAAAADCSQPSAPGIEAIQARLRDAAGRTPARRLGDRGRVRGVQAAREPAPDPGGPGPGRARPSGGAVPHVPARLRAQFGRTAGGRVRRRAARSAWRRVRPRRRGTAGRGGVRGADVRPVRAEPAA